ncbi:MAG: hypothetical protein QM770_22320 [Tepidisphaeraceae bacterium]
MNRVRAQLRKGLTIVEMLIALTISVAILTATAAAIDATCRSYAANQNIADTNTRARLAMTRMITELRDGSDHVPTASAQLTSFRAGSSVTDTGISFTAQDGTTIVYRYNSTARTLETVRNGAAAITLARGVDTFSINLRPSAVTPPSARAAATICSTARR